MSLPFDIIHSIRTTSGSAGDTIRDDLVVVGACSAMRSEGSGGGSSEFTDIMHAYRLIYNVGSNHYITLYDLFIYDCFVTLHSVSSTVSVPQCHNVS